MTDQQNMDQTKKQSVKKQPKQSRKELKEIEKLREENELLRNELLEKDDKNLRLLAEIQNLQKQHEIDLTQGRKSGKKAVSETILSFLNTLNISFAFVPETADEKTLNFVETLKKSYEKLIADLQNMNIEVIVPQVGDVFNAEFMASLNDNPSGDEEPTVKAVANIGLKVDDQLVSPANVML